MLVAALPLVLAALSQLHTAQASQIYQGDGTAYTLSRTDVGNCNMMTALPASTTHYAALNNDQWGSLEHCGRCAEVSCIDPRCADKSKTEVIQILDRCPECKYGDLDLSPTVFRSLTGVDPNRYKIQWRFVDCPVSGNIKYCLKEGSNPFWIAIQPNNVASGVTSLTINGQRGKQLGSAYYYLIDGAGQSQGNLGAVRTTITSINGETIQETVALSAGQCTEGNHQFARGGSGGDTTKAPTTAATVTQAPKATTASTSAKATTTATGTTNSPPKTASKAHSASSVASATTEVAGEADSSASANTGSEAETGTKDATEATKTKNLDMTNAAYSQESDVMGTVAPASSTTGANEVTTKQQASSGATSPMLLVLGAFGVVAAIALVAVVAVVRRNRIAEQNKDDFLDDFARYNNSSMASSEGIVTLSQGVL